MTSTKLNHDVDYKLRSSLRIMGVNTDCIESLNYLLKQCTHKIAPLYNNELLKNIIIPISDDTNEALLKEILSKVTNTLGYDLFVSVSSLEQSLVIEVPSAVLQLHSFIGGKVCFSYTCMYDEQG